MNRSRCKNSYHKNKTVENWENCVKLTKHWSKIILVENENITDDIMNAEIMNDYFVNITKELNIPEIMTEILHGNIDMDYIHLYIK